MKRTLFGAVGFLWLCASLLAADAPVLHFNAVLTAGKEKRFGLSSEAGAKSSWLTIGQTFEGYTLKSFDDAAQTLQLEKDGQTVKMPLDLGKILTADTKATLADAEAVIQKIHFEEMISRSLDAQKQAMIKMTQQATAKNGQPRTEQEKAEIAAFQSKLFDTLWSEMKPEQIKTDMIAAYSELFTKDQLQSLSDFYSSEAGQAFITKQPELQQKLMASMMPRMMAAMPKIQQMSRDFAAAHAPAPATPAPAAPSAPPSSGTP